MDADSDLDLRIAGIAALDQPVRRDPFRLLCRAEGWTSRDEASDALRAPAPTARPPARLVQRAPGGGLVPRH
jgi:hypothetical protein